MKKISVILMAFSIVLGMSQCKKNVETINSNIAETVAITLNVDNGSKLNVTPGSGSIEFTSGDIIYVASNGVYVGALTYSDNKFSGTITNPTSGLPLYFYFLGNQTPHLALTAGTSTEVVVDIFNQTSENTLPIISCERSDQNYPTADNKYTAVLKNKCALVQFNVSTEADGQNTYITGLNNKVKFTFGSTDPEYSKMGTGAINIGTRTGEFVWALLLPQTISENSVVAYSADWVYKGTASMEFDVIAANMCYNVPSYVNVSTNNNKTLPGDFTYNGKVLHYSAGNLQYQASTDTWRFAEHQYDFVGDATIGNVYDGAIKSNNANIADNYSGWIDLFGWGTSGWNNGNLFYQPYDSQSSNEQGSPHSYAIGNGYGPTNGTDYSYDLTGGYAEADWGYHNSISNGGNAVHMWRVKTANEHDGTFSTERAAMPFAKVRLNWTGVDVNGLMVFPDEWTADNYALLRGNDGNSNYYDVINEENFLKLEASGAVFYPAGGYRVGTTVSQLNAYGEYWTSTSYNKSSTDYRACNLGWDTGSIHNNEYFSSRFCGNAVRLVRIE